ncbi:AraC family transcriptional regulator [Hydrogenophaga sp. T2]|uniref:AraC family transcriptional regulator n=1 Tax=Hydrogenophaga sp. T2 TaxID=3132823 RepID=UPI003CF1340A
MRPEPPTSDRAPRAAPASPHPNAQAANRAPRPVAALARSDPAGVVIAAHRHDRDQLIYATQGVMTIRAQGVLWTIPPSHAMWMPAQVEHEIRMDTAVEMRTLYFWTGTVPGQDEDCHVLAVTPLLRELILRAMSIPPAYGLYSPEGRVMDLIVDEVGRLERRPLSLRLPTDKRLARLCRLLIADPGNTEPIAELGRRVGLSERSVIRLFPQETGLSLHRWRQQLRLMRAFALADQGLNVGQLADQLGYASASAFGKMFAKQFGCAPRGVLGTR